MKPMNRMLRPLLAGAASFTLIAACAEADVRIRDIVDVEGVRQNDLVGYGIVVGLNGTGDSVRNSPFTEDTLTHMLERLGVNVQGEAIKPNNVAAVLVTATLPAFAREGSTIDISVASIGDAKSLEGGTLILTPLKGADNEVYAVAQGSVLVAGLEVKAKGASERRGTPTTGAVPEGARVEREIRFDFNASRVITLALRDPDFTTAARVEDTINAALKQPAATIRDPATVELDLSSLGTSPARTLATIENLLVSVSTPARIVIDEKSGTIVFSEDVTLSEVAISQGGISIKVNESTVVSQPNPFAKGQTVALPRSTITIEQTSEGSLTVLKEAASLSDLVKGLNALGVSTTDMADIIRAMRAAGAIHADLVVR
jgi:flagellar P-ring protein precursor FlgI